MDGTIKQWLQELPLSTPVEIDGETVYLALREGGAELGATLFQDYTPAQLENALAKGFHSATLFDAGLGCSANGKSLVLNQWLPGVAGWTEAAQALEALLNQLSMWRDELNLAGAARSDNTAIRTEQRLRKQFTGVKP